MISGRAQSNFRSGHKSPTMLNHFRHYLDLTRTYTWIDAAATGLLGYFTGSPAHNWFVAATCIVPLSLLLWILLNWVSEHQQRDEGRTPPPGWLICLPIFGSVALAASLNINALPILSIHLFLIYLYPYKKTIRWLASVCFLIRGLQTASLFLLAVNLGATLSFHAWVVASGLLLLQASRSLIAEVRDAPFDQWGLPSEIRRITSTYTSEIACLLIAILSGTVGAFLLGTPAFAVWIIMVFLILVYVYRYHDCLPVASYFIHCWSITVSVVIKGVSCIALPLWAAIGFGLLSFIIGQVEYPRVFRPVNELLPLYPRRLALRLWLGRHDM